MYEVRSTLTEQQDGLRGIRSGALRGDPVVRRRVLRRRIGRVGLAVCPVEARAGLCSRPRAPSRGRRRRTTRCDLLKVDGPLGIGAGFGRRNGAVEKRSGTRRSLIIENSLAEWTGLEPATPGVTGRYSNQLNYHSDAIRLVSRIAQTWRPLGDSNPCNHRERVVS